MIKIVRNKEEEINRDEITIPILLIESPLLKSHSKILLMYLLVNDKAEKFSWSTFESRTGVGRRERQNAQSQLVNLNIISLAEYKVGMITAFNITLNYSIMINHLNQPMKTKKRMKRFSNKNKRSMFDVQNEHPLDVQNVHGDETDLMESDD